MSYTGIEPGCSYGEEVLVEGWVPLQDQDGAAARPVGPLNRLIGG